MKSSQNGVQVSYQCAKDNTIVEAQFSRLLHQNPYVILLTIKHLLFIVNLTTFLDITHPHISNNSPYPYVNFLRPFFQTINHPCPRNPFPQTTQRFQAAQASPATEIMGCFPSRPLPPNPSPPTLSAATPKCGAGFNPRTPTTTTPSLPCPLTYKTSHLNG